MEMRNLFSKYRMCLPAEKANRLPCPLGVKEEGIRLTGLRDKEERKQGSAGAYGSGFSR